ncbi:glutaredoxin family protein [Litorilituus sediminis]|uniref:Thioredoxin family protein n=1 Tax=Litorilituus sediminis TaxID=718192 RepID=A0A4P6P6L0_9GAMM|nr:glutaredoxin family protein [Litorilituus sediminis]QBG35062.1 thioredoxin family protein [Litorilituus sediminis]
MIVKKFNLYGSEGCHLCEQALAICLPLIPADELAQIDIIEQESVPHEQASLVELYGVHIPVLERLSDNKKLFWPFDVEQVAGLL